MKNLMSIIVTLFFMCNIFRYFHKIQRKEFASIVSKSPVQETIFMDWIMLIISTFTFIYLAVTLLMPEKF